MNIPCDNINICILGCVSAGKSTILNAMFCQDYSQSKIKRTTMMPTAFVETRNAKLCQSQVQISQTIANKNQEIILMTEKGQILNLETHGNQLVFYVDKLDIKISEKFNITLFDIPGLNDARTKEQYFNYLRKNFHLFNIVIFVVNIESGLNTSDEMDILNLIADNIDLQSKKEKKIRMLTVANKADEMQINQNKNPEIVGEELKEMYNQINNTISQVFKRKKLDSLLIGTVPICGVDAHLFRMIKSQGDKYQLNPTQIQRIGTSEMGTRFRSKTPAEQLTIVKRVLSNIDFIDEMIKLSGFERIDKLLADCIKKEAVQMASSNIAQELNNLKPLSIDNLIDTIEPILTIYAKIQKFDKKDYDTKMQDLVKQIHTQIFNKINTLNDIISIINFYDHIFNALVNSKCNIKLPASSGFGGFVSSLSFSDNSITIYQMLEPYHDFNKFPTYLINIVVDLVKKEFTEKIIPIDKLKYFLQIETIGFLSKEVIEMLLEKIILNGNKTKTINFSNGIKNNELIQIFDKIKIADNFLQFLRFLIRNMIESNTIDKKDIIMKLLFYKRFGEIPIQEYIRFKLSKEVNLLEKYGYVFDDGLSENDEQLEIDNYYIDIAKKIQPYQFLDFNIV